MADKPNMVADKGPSPNWEPLLDRLRDEQNAKISQLCSIQSQLIRKLEQGALQQPMVHSFVTSQPAQSRRGEHPQGELPHGTQPHHRVYAPQNVVYRMVFHPNM